MPDLSQSFLYQINQYTEKKPTSDRVKASRYYYILFIKKNDCFMPVISCNYLHRGSKKYIWTILATIFLKIL